MLVVPPTALNITDCSCCLRYSPNELDWQSATTMSTPTSSVALPWRNQQSIWESQQLSPPATGRSIFPRIWHSSAKLASPASYAPWGVSLCACAKRRNLALNAALYQAPAKAHKYEQNWRKPDFQAILKSLRQVRLPLP